MQKTDALTLQFGDATITVPADAAARAYLEKFMAKPFAETLVAQPHGATPPQIGEPWKGGTYAGLSLVGNQPVHLILLRQTTHSHHDRARLARLVMQRGHVVDGGLTKTFRRST